MAPELGCAADTASVLSMQKPGHAQALLRRCCSAAFTLQVTQRHCNAVECRSVAVTLGNLQIKLWQLQHSPACCQTLAWQLPQLLQLRHSTTVAELSCAAATMSMHPKPEFAHHRRSGKGQACGQIGWCYRSCTAKAQLCSRHSASQFQQDSLSVATAPQCRSSARLKVPILCCAAATAPLQLQHSPGRCQNSTLQLTQCQCNLSCLVELW